jgi:hypothetical protein
MLSEASLRSWNELINDCRNPLYNLSISARDTPAPSSSWVTALGGCGGGHYPRYGDLDKGAFHQTDAVPRPRLYLSQPAVKHAI